ncbi:MAG TPA: MFS transporter [Thermomicrobiaceae bacterium]|nr:MFS transporter [Thermomicrobiaceae bacterium]
MGEPGRAAPASRLGTGSRLAVLRHHDFRLLWGGELLSTVGSQMQLFAVNWQVLQLAGSRSLTLSLAGIQLGLRADALALGTLGFVRVLPTLLLALLGGALADTRDRRAVVTAAQLAAAAVAGTLAAVSLTGHAGIGALYLLSAAGTAAAALAQPAQQALVPRLVERAELANAYSLYALLWQVGALAGPPLAALAIAGAGFGVVYAVNAVSFLAVVAAVRVMRVRGAVASPADGALRRGSLGEGWRFARTTPLIRQTLLIDLYATFFGSARGMVPLVAVRVLHLGVRGYGVLATAQPVGAFLTGTVLTLRREIRHQGRVLLACVGLFGAAWAAFGLVDVLALSYLAYAVTGAADTVSYVIRTTIRQTMTPDALRGRVVGVHLVLGDAGPEFGELEAGLVAALAGAPAAIVVGGLATVIATGLGAWRWPELRGYREPAMEEQAGSLRPAI